MEKLPDDQRLNEDQALFIFRFANVRNTVCEEEDRRRSTEVGLESG